MQNTPSLIARKDSRASWIPKDARESRLLRQARFAEQTRMLTGHAICANYSLTEIGFILPLNEKGVKERENFNPEAGGISENRMTFSGKN